MTRRVVALGLLASAFAPVVAVLAVLQWNSLGVLKWWVLAACLVALGLLALVLKVLARVQQTVLEPKQVRRADQAVLAFASTYIVPVAVAAFAEDDAATVVGTGALIAIIAVIYVRAQLYHLNPTLALLGYRLYEVTLENDTVTMVLTRKGHLAQTAPIDARRIGDDVAIQIGGNS